MNPASDIIIDVHGLTKKFDGRAVVRNLTLQVKRGTIYGFLGPNGSGKTFACCADCLHPMKVRAPVSATTSAPRPRKSNARSDT